MIGSVCTTRMQEEWQVAEVFVASGGLLQCLTPNDVWIGESIRLSHARSMHDIRFSSAFCIARIQDPSRPKQIYLDVSWYVKERKRNQCKYGVRWIAETHDHCPFLAMVTLAISVF